MNKYSQKGSAYAQFAFGDSTSRKLNDEMFSNTTNKIKTTRYTWYSWFPKSLIWQFRRVDNYYFLLITFLTFMPFSSKSSIKQLVTFLCVLFITMIKEGAEDLIRYKQDCETNSKSCLNLYKDDSAITEKTVKWEDIQVGDVIKIIKNQEIPADVLLISSSHKNNNVYVDTKNIDGETNLKLKQVIPQLQGKECNLKGRVICDLPNANLVYWNGKMEITNGAVINASIDNLLLRGSYLKSPEHIIGLVVYVGEQTKIMQNTKSAPTKMSKVLFTLNYIIYSMLAFQICIIIIFAGCHIYWRKANKEQLGYLDSSSDPSVKDYFIQFLTYWVSYSHFINVSMYVYLQILKVIMALQIIKDHRMYDSKFKEFTQSRTSDIIEELGQVRFIFSDKTGTITTNQLKFKKFKIGNMSCNLDSNEDIQTIQNVLYKENSEILDPCNLLFQNIALCNSVIPYQKQNVVTYEGANTDELSLLQGAKLLSYDYISKEGNIITLRTIETKQFIIHAVLPFDSNRKRMSVITSSLKNPSLMLLLTKGSDETVLTKINYLTQSKSSIQNDIDELSKEGLRTLVFAYKIISKQDADTFNTAFEQTKSFQIDKKLIEQQKLFNQMEDTLTYIGVTGIEDKLQEGVPDTISKLMKAGIRIWMLTGDKYETALNIAYNAKFVNASDDQVILISKENVNIGDQMKSELQSRGIKNYENPLTIEEYDNKMMLVKPFYIAISGEMLSIALLPENAQMFFNLCMHSQSIICCRLTPKQKEEVVKFIKCKGNWVTLSIGDGANDSPMLMEAHIGVAVRGFEGSQAVLSSDYVICKFRYLQNLLLGHGRNGYMRIAGFISYYFYKNCIILFTELPFVLLNGFSGQIFFIDIILLMHNTTWSLVPILCSYAHEFDFSNEQSIHLPFLYNAGQKDYYFNFKTFWTQIASSAQHGFTIYFLVVYFFLHSGDSNGMALGHWEISMICFTVALYVSNLRLLINTYNWNIISL